MGLAFLITTENLQLLGERKVLKEAEYAALLDAGQVVAAARAEAQRIVEQAMREAEEHRRRGHAEGMERAKAEVAQRLVSEALASERQLRALRTSMAGIVVKALSQFVAEADPARLIAAALARVDSLIRHEPFIGIRVAPAQEAALREVLEHLRDEAQWSMTVSVQPDASLPAGGCVVQTASGTLDIGIDAQLEAFRRVIERGGIAEAAS